MRKTLVLLSFINVCLSASGATAFTTDYQRMIQSEKDYVQMKSENDNSYACPFKKGGQGSHLFSPGRNGACTNGSCTANLPSRSFQFDYSTH